MPLYRHCVYVWQWLWKVGSSGFSALLPPTPLVKYWRVAIMYLLLIEML